MVAAIRRTAVAASVLTLSMMQALTAEGVTYTVTEGESIQGYLDIVQPGDVVEIEEGIYLEDLRTKVHGLKDSPITIRGAGAAEDSVVHGTGINARVFEVYHEYYILEGFMIDGKDPNIEPNGQNYEQAFRDKLLYVHGQELPTEREGPDGKYMASIDGLIVRRMIIKNAGGECIRLRYFVAYADFHDNEILNCGIHDFSYSAGGKNGEGIYVGTSSNQWGDGKNPTDDPDACVHNRIRHNKITTNGNEGVDVKEGSEYTIIEENAIYLQHDTDSGGIDSRADYTIIRYNYIEDAEGAGIRIGGHKIGSHQYGVYNEVYGNEMYDCRAYGVKLMASPQTKVCGNIIHLPPIYNGDASKYDFVGGTFKSDFDPRAECVVTPAPTPAPTLGTIGCYADKRGSRAMTLGYRSTRMTNEVCAKYCLDNNYVYSGTQFSRTCWCGNTSDYAKHGESTACTMSCAGDSGEICGGRLALTVSATGFDTAARALTVSALGFDTPAPTPYKGCFADISTSRVLHGEKMTSSAMTVKMCVEFCDDASEEYAGLQNGNECYCGSSHNYGKYGIAECSTPCAGKSNEYCGGVSALSVWEVYLYD